MTAGTNRSVAARVKSPAFKRRAILGLKLAVTVALSVWITSLVHWGRFWTALDEAQGWLIAFVAVLLVAGLVISALKWQQLLAVHGLRYRLSLLVRWYLVAAFLNHFLPSSIGGDGYRIYKTWHNDRGRSASVLAIVLERISGMAALALLGYGAAIVLLLERQHAVAEAVVTVGTVGLLIASAAAVAMSRGLLLGRLPAEGRWGRWIETGRALLTDVRAHPARLMSVGLISFVFHVNKILAVWLVMLALGVAVNPLTLTVALFAVEVAGLIPLSIGGLGLIEGSFILAMGQFGVGEEVSLATMLLMRALVIPFSLIGAVFYFLSDRPQAIGATEGRAGDPAHVK